MSASAAFSVPTSELIPAGTWEVDPNQSSVEFQVKHVVVLMMENHSFDNLLGMVPFRVPGR